MTRKIAKPKIGEAQTPKPVSPELPTKPNTRQHKASAEALPEDLLSQGVVRGTCSIDIPALQKMPMRELHAFREAIHTISEVISGFTCQPCFHKDDDVGMPGVYKPNEAGDVLESIEEFLNSYEQAVVNVASSAKPATADDAEWRGWTILGFEADMCDDLAPFAVLAAEAVRDEAEAKFLEARGRGIHPP